MPENPDLLTNRFRLSPIGPNQVSDDWLRWTNDSDLMRQINAGVISMKRSDLERYVVAAQRVGRAIIGIYAQDGAHIGLYEAEINREHRNVNFNVLIDQKRYDFSDVLRETDPVMLEFLAKRRGMEKAIARVVETYVPALRHYEETGWTKEGVLRAEHPAVDGSRRLDVVQFGKLL